jgi:hypothetical protein
MYDLLFGRNWPSCEGIDSTPWTQAAGSHMTCESCCVDQVHHLAEPVVCMSSLAC